MKTLLLVKSDGVTGLMMDQSQTDILLESWRSSQPDRLTAYKNITNLLSIT